MPAGRPKGDRRLPECREAGLCCRECVAAAAENVAAISGELGASLVRQLFFLMYPHTACAPMATEFVQILNARTPGNEPARAIAAPEQPKRWRAAVA